jgi:hypothetical protein
VRTQKQFFTDSANVLRSLLMVLNAHAPELPMLYLNRALAKAHGYEPADLSGREPECS